MKNTFTIPILAQDFSFVNNFREILEKLFNTLLIYSDIFLSFPLFHTSECEKNFHFFDIFVKILFIFAIFTVYNLETLFENYFHFAFSPRKSVMQRQGGVIVMWGREMIIKSLAR
jgi:hypothetical protein